MEKIIKCKRCGKVLKKGHVLDHYLEEHPVKPTLKERFIRFMRGW